jgi:hypothetical protein
MRAILPIVLLVTAIGAPLPSTPGVRNAHVLAYDESRGVTLLFGGASASAVLGDTWTWDGARWRPLPAAGPAPRTFPGFVWDAARGEAVLFGGRRVLFGREGDGDTFLDDTWLLRADGWHRSTGASPPPRAEAGFAYDRDRQVGVLFGGYHEAGGVRTRLGDTWEWDGRAWHHRADTGPSARNGVAMAYDERLRWVVLFGGSGGPKSDTWTWDGRAWTEVVTPPTDGRFNAVAAFDAVRQRIVRATGWTGSARVAETWLFTGAAWQRATSTGPSPRNHSAVAFDRRRGRLVLYGGHDGDFVFGDLWEWDGRRWADRLRVPHERRVGNRH